MPPRLLCTALLLLLAACKPASVPPSTTSVPLPDLDPITEGRRIKVVWAESATPGTADVAAQGPDLLLMGLDSTDPRGIRPLLDKPRNIFRPLLSPDGNSVIFTERLPQPHILLLDWQTSALADYGPGIAVAVWAQAGVPVPWIYALEDLDDGARGGLIGKRLIRFTTAQPAEREILYAETPIDAEGFQLSRDATHACALLPAPEASLLNLITRTSRKLATAAWPILAPDNSYATATLNADHGQLNFTAPQSADPWAINLPTLLWHPRWSNHPALITYTAAYPIAPNQPAFKDNPHALDAEIYLARLNATATEILASVPLTHNHQGDTHPDLWVENAFLETLASLPQTPDETPPAPPLPWPVPTALDHALFAFSNAATDMPLALPDGTTRLPRPTPHANAHLGRFWDLDISRGYYTADPETNTAIAPALLQSQAFTLEFLLTETLAGYEPLSVRLLSYRNTDGTEALGLYRLNQQLIFRLRLGPDAATSQVHSLPLLHFRIDNERGAHLALTLQDGHLNTYLNGNLVAQNTLEIPTLNGWTPGTLQFGDPAPLGTTGWTGALENILLTSDALPQEILQQHAASALQKFTQRKATDRLKLQGTLTHVSPSPADPDASPYPRILTARTYEIAHVDSGTYTPTHIVVLHDAYLNHHPLPNLPDTLAHTYPLLVEPLSQHPELKAAQIQNTTPLPDLPLFLEVSPPPP